MKEYSYSLLLAFAAGMLTVLQGAINASIGRTNGQYAMIIGVSLVQVAMSMVLLRAGGSFPTITSAFSPWMLVSGLLGVGIMFSVSKATGTAGALPVFVTAIAAQISASAVMGHWGLMGLPRSPFTLQKLGSMMLIAAGIYGLLKSQSS
ncbi:DMT family transporter [Cohnella terricola]|uniref:DMT family transporter n=1 Tax=Cohnella terricola TaxID=1289167 RepID=A0A559J9Y5_9BACL|nr:DMT family transporter [Cohnella terricola]TVX96699.1 hypothetical protein FPZ45_20690 [Cohnella terricola]